MGTLADHPAPLADPLVPVPYRVLDVRQETADVVTLTVGPVDASPVGHVLPGQFVMVWAFGVGEIPISVSRTAGDRVLLTVRAVGRVSDVITSLRVDDVLGLRGPFGTAWPVGDVVGRDVIVVAGGLGLAPLRMAIDGLVAADPAAVTVVVGARQPEQIVFADDLDAWAARGAAVHRTVDTATRAWSGGVGTATAMVERLRAEHDAAFVCGPELMMTSSVRALLHRRVPADHTWVSLERNMHCGIGHCGRCQLGALLLCRDGAVVRWDRVEELMEVRGR